MITIEYAVIEHERVRIGIDRLYDYNKILDTVNEIKDTYQYGLLWYTVHTENGDRIWL